MPDEAGPVTFRAMSTRRTDLAMLFVVLIWGVNFSVMKGAFQYIPPLAFTAIRFVAGSALLLPLARRPAGEAPLSWPVMWRLIVIGVLGNTVYQILFILGLASTTASNSAVLLAAMPVLVAVMAALLGFDRARPRVFWGIGIATVGVVLVVAARGIAFSNATLIGDLMTISAAFCWAGYTLGLRTLPANLSPLRVTAITTIAGTPGLVLAGVPQLGRLDWSAIGVKGWSALVYSTLLSLVTAYVLWTRSVQAVGPSRTVVYTCLTPLVACVVAWGMLGEQLHLLQGVGAAFIIGGVLLTRR
jgi:drug/metabolite transporter (DMT)-like permease